MGELGGSCYMVFDNIAIEYSVIDRRQAAIIKNRLIFARVEIYQTFYSNLSNSPSTGTKMFEFGSGFNGGLFCPPSELPEIFVQKVGRVKTTYSYRRLQSLAKLGIRFHKLARWFFKLPRWFYKLPMLLVKLVSGFCASVINCKPLSRLRSGL